MQSKCAWNLCVIVTWVTCCCFPDDIWAFKPRAHMSVSRGDRGLCVMDQYQSCCQRQLCDHSASVHVEPAATRECLWLYPWDRHEGYGPASQDETHRVLHECFTECRRLHSCWCMLLQISAFSLSDLYHNICLMLSCDSFLNNLCYIGISYNILSGTSCFIVYVALTLNDHKHERCLLSA